MDKNKDKKVINFKNVSFRYKKNRDLVLKKINFSLEEGNSLTIVGKNGSGKSTIGQIIAGLLLSFEGEVEIFGESLTKKNYQHLIKWVGLVFQDPESQFIGEDVESDIAFGLENMNIPYQTMFLKIREILKKLNLSSIFYEEPSNLSGGQKQKVTIASVLVTDPKIIIFDEPTSMLDYNSKTEIFEIIDALKKNPKVTVIEITHDIERILTSDKILLVKEGNVDFFHHHKDLLLQREDILDSLGIELPFIYKLSKKLKKAKIIDKNFLEEKELLNHLWKKKKFKLKI